MASKKKLEEIHDDALECFRRIQEVSKDERKQSLGDRRFCCIPGAQWEGDLADQYANRPKFEVNKIHLSVIRIINEYRNNRVTVDFAPKTGKADELSELCDGMFRSDENDSDAMEAYDNAFEEAVMGGFGAYRLRSEYEDEYDDENDNQRIRIEPIYDADMTVFFDMDAKKQDKSDAKHCFVLSSMTPEAYEEEFDDDPASWPADVNTESFDWHTPDMVYVAEYYKVDEKSEWKVYYETLTGEEECYWEKDLDEEEIERMMMIGHEETRRRKIKRKKIHKYIMSGAGVLEDCGQIAGKEIPIIPVYGKRWYIENIERFMGHVRLAKDAQRLKNMQLSKLGEISALSSVEKPILTPEQIAGHQIMWSEDNIKDYPYLLINPLTNEEGQTVAQGPIAYTKPSSVPPALGALLQITEEDMKDILGHYERGEELESHISGKAVELVQTRLDMQTYLFLSNEAKAKRRCGEVWLSMAKDVYIEDEREVKVVSADGKSMGKKIRVKKVGENGEIMVANDLDNANFDVNVEIGPSSSSKRDAIIRQVTGMIQYAQDPETQQVLSSMAMMNMEGEGTADVREYFRKKLVRMGAVPPTEEDIEQMQLNPDQPTPNDQYLLAEAQRATAEAKKNEADTIETRANAELKQAQAAEIKMRLNMPSEAPQQEQGPVRDEAREAEIVIQARKAKHDMDIKEREIALKELEMQLRAEEQKARLAEIGSRILDRDDDMDVKENYGAAEEVASDLSSEVESIDQ